MLTSLKASDVQGKYILLTFQPASDCDKTIFNSYSSIFDVPTHAVYMKPVLLVDGEIVPEGEEYLGKLLNLAGKLYFAQVDIADTIAADMYDVAVTRSFSEGITGYEVQTSSLYGMVTGISEGSLYIDVDTDSHSVVSLVGEEDVPREYMFSTGIMSSLYESTVWEELTGYESVSTISILSVAQEEGTEILLISKDNLSTEIKKLNTDETTKQTVINAVNSGNIVTIPSEDVTMGDWSGTGYIVTNPETGAGAYMISGGLNGGAVEVIAGVPVMLASFLLVVGTVYGITLAISGILVVLAAFTPLMFGIAIAAIIFGIVPVICSIAGLYSIWTDYTNFILTGDDKHAESSSYKSMWVGIWTIVFTVISIVVGKLFFKWCENYVKETGGSGETGGIVDEGYTYTPKNKTTLWGQEKYVTEDGLNAIKQHLSGDLADEFNDAMINRLENAYMNKTKISGADLDFYSHEIYESDLMKNGMNYNDAHEAAKAYYNATEFNLYHPEVIKAYPQLFNNAWFEFWGIERN